MAGTDEDEIWRIIIADHAAWWMRDLKAYAAFHTRLPTDRWWAAIMTIGITRNSGWEMMERHQLAEYRSDPDPNPFFAYESRFEDRCLRIVGDVAWATFDCVFPTAGLPGFRGPAVAHEIRILERREDGWKIALVALMDDQFAQTETPIWQIEPDGSIVWRNPAATHFEKTESELAIRAGRIHLRGAETDRRLYEAIARVAAADAGVMAPSVSVPVLYDPGNDLPARIWWVNTQSRRLFVSFNDQRLLLERLERASIAFELSPAQHRLAASIVEGLTVMDAAKREHIRPSTARTHLQRIFDKVGVRTQPALVRALMSASEPQ